ncbi:MAG: alpha/beta hydrolase [Desulfobacteraceae bacterium]|nr:alpha/beta hydrolase [Desulfobacteraceae bacterium]
MKLIIQILSLGMAVYFFILIALYFFQDKMLFFPGGSSFGKCPDMDRFKAKAVSIKGIRYYLQTKPDPKSWIVIFHGNAGNACDRTYFFDLLKEFNSNIVIFEYPGYGKDSNSPGEDIILDQAKKLIDHLKQIDKEKLPIYLMGESIGTGVATFLASQTQIKGLILISAYTSIAKVAQFHYSWLPVERLMRHKFEAHHWAKQTRTSALLFHGIVDDIIPIQFARGQIINFKGKKELVEIKGCGHNDITDVGEEVIKQKIKEFLVKTLE